MSRKKPRYYTYQNKRYIVTKVVDGVTTYFDRFNTEYEAKRAVKYLKGNGWDKKDYNTHYKIKKPLRNIIATKKGYIVRKYINGKLHHYGFYHNLKTAMYERDLFESCDWDWNRIVEEEVEE